MRDQVLERLAMVEMIDWVRGSRILVERRTLTPPSPWEGEGEEGGGGYV